MHSFSCDIRRHKINTSTLLFKKNWKVCSGGCLSPVTSLSLVIWCMPSDFFRDWDYSWRAPYTTAISNRYRNLQPQPQSPTATAISNRNPQPHPQSPTATKFPVYELQHQQQPQHRFAVLVCSCCRSEFEIFCGRYKNYLMFDTQNCYLIQKDWTDWCGVWEQTATAILLQIAVAADRGWTKKKNIQQKDYGKMTFLNGN